MLRILDATTSVLTNLTRCTSGARGGELGARPERPLKLYAFEACPFCRRVRELLCSLELPYLLHNVAKGSPRRPAFAESSGRIWVPYLYDPNTDVGWFESGKIVAYLEAAYAQ